MVLIVVHTQTEQFVIRLLQRGAIVSTAGPDGNTPLHLAALRGFVEVGRSLLDHDAKTMAKNNEKQIPLQLAIMNSRNDFAVLMIKTMEQSRSGDHSVLHIAKEMLRLMTITMLYAAGFVTCSWEVWICLALSACMTFW